MKILAATALKEIVREAMAGRVTASRMKEIIATGTANKARTGRVIRPPGITRKTKRIHHGMQASIMAHPKIRIRTLAMVAENMVLTMAVETMKETAQTTKAVLGEAATGLLTEVQ